MLCSTSRGLVLINPFRGKAWAHWPKDTARWHTSMTLEDHGGHSCSPRSDQSSFISNLGCHTLQVTPGTLAIGSQGSKKTSLRNILDFWTSGWKEYPGWTSALGLQQWQVLSGVSVDFLKVKFRSLFVPF